MNPADNIKRFFKNASVSTNPKADEAIVNQLIQAHKKAAKEKLAEPGINTWGIIMHSRITKITAAAVIIVAVVITINVIDRSVPAAFGIEQVIDAYNNVRFLHVKQLRQGQKNPNEFWIKSDEQGRVVKARYYLPETEDGVKLITWTPERAEIWFKSKHGFLICQAENVEGWMQSIMEQCQPKLVMKKLLEDKEAGKVDIDIQKPQQRQEPAVIVATYKIEPKKEIYYITQATDLITHIEFYRIEENGEILTSTTEFYDYNVPIDEKMFSLKDEVPKDVRIADQLTQLTGVAQADMNDAQAAEETVRQFFQALIDKDYKKVGLIYGGTLEEYAKEEFDGLNVISIVSIGPAIPQPDWEDRGFRVPCELEIINSDGQKIIWKSGPYVRPGDDEKNPDRWHITGGVSALEAQIKILPDNEMYERMTPKQAAEAFFKACSEKDWEEFSKFMPSFEGNARLEQMEEQLKEYLGGLEVISIGEPFQKGDYPGWFVPYEIKLPGMEFNTSLSNKNPAGRYVMTGICDSKLRTLRELTWTNEPNVLPNNDEYASMSPADVVRAFNDAYGRGDVEEMRKFAPDSFVEEQMDDYERWKEGGQSKDEKPFLESVGEAFWSEEHSAYFVRCRLPRLIKKHNLAIRNDNIAKRYMFDGGI